MASSIGVVERKSFFGQENDKVVVKWGSTVDGGQIAEKYSKNVSGVELIIDPLQLTVTWYKIHHPREQAMDWDIQNKENSSLTGSEVVLFWMFQCETYSPSWRILYHATVSCKWPIEQSMDGL